MMMMALLLLVLYYVDSYNLKQTNDRLRLRQKEYRIEKVDPNFNVNVLLLYMVEVNINTEPIDKYIWRIVLLVGSFFF